MKKLFFLIVFSLIMGMAMAQVETLKGDPIYIDDTLVVIGVSAKTTDTELLEIRTKLLKFTTIRFIEFDVIREPSSKRDEEGDIQFISLEVDCRDGYIGRISHSFEKGDNSIQGFYRNYSKNTYSRAFFIGKLADNFIPKEKAKVQEDEMELNLDQNDIDNQKVEQIQEKKSFCTRMKKIFFWKKN